MHHYMLLCWLGYGHRSAGLLPLPIAMSCLPPFPVVQDYGQALAG